MAQVGSVNATTLKPESLEQDTVEGARIFCSVKSAGAGYNLEAYAAKGANALQIKVNGLSLDKSQTGWAEGNVVFSSTPSENPYNTPSDNPCHFYFLTDAQRNFAGPGKIWFSFDCPVVEYVSGGSQCQLRTSHAAFELCDE